MRKPGTDENNVRMSDVLCDFCLREWAEDRPVIEGHRGSIICGDCLTEAYRRVVLEGAGAAPEALPAGTRCTMCLEVREERAWLGPGEQEGGKPAAVCRRCIELAAKALAKDKDWKWTPPT